MTGQTWTAPPHQGLLEIIRLFWWLRTRRHREPPYYDDTA